MRGIKMKKIGFTELALAAGILAEQAKSMVALGSKDKDLEAALAH